MATYFLRINATTDEISWTTTPGTDPIIVIDTSTDVPEWKAGNPGGLAPLLIDDATDEIFWFA